MDELDQFENVLSEALLRAGCNGYSVAELRQDCRNCRDEIYEDCQKHGQDPEDPFVNFIIVEGTAIFTFFEAEFSVYLCSCTESELISQTNEMAMVDVDAHRKLVREVYGRPKPDAVLSREAANLWMES